MTQPRGTVADRGRLHRGAGEHVGQQLAAHTQLHFDSGAQPGQLQRHHQRSMLDRPPVQLREAVDGVRSPRELAGTDR